MSKYYKLLGKLCPSDCSFLEKEIKKRHIPGINFQRVEFDQDLINFMNSIFENTELKVQRTPDGKRAVQKAFYSTEIIYPIHKDGTRCMSALNIAISCNRNDWVRWYEDDIINSISTAVLMKGPNGTIRNTKIEDIESVQYAEQFIPSQGDVYVLDVNSYHTWKCSGDNPRIIIQTKFEGFPDFETISPILSKSSFRGLIRELDDALKFSLV